MQHDKHFARRIGELLTSIRQKKGKRKRGEWKSEPNARTETAATAVTCDFFFKKKFKDTKLKIFLE